MKKYFLNDGTAQQGPFDLDELKSKNITAETPIWYEGLPEWTTAGKLDELRELFVVVPPPYATTPAVEEVQPVAPVEEVVIIPPVSAEPIVIKDITPDPVTVAPATAAATVTATPAPAKTKPVVAAAAGAKKGSKAVAWITTLLVLGGAGFFVYQDMDKNSGDSKTLSVQTTTNDTTKTTTPTTDVTTTTTTTDTASTNTNTADTATTTVTPTTDPTTPPTTTTTTTTTTTSNDANAKKLADQKAAAAKKAEEEKKKQAALKKAADDKKKADAAKAAQLAKEMEMRQHWSKYITFGNLNFETKGDGIKPFDVPVYNGTDAMLDKVTVRIEYVKKNEKKIFKTETITIYNVPAHGGLNGKAPESKKGEKVNVYFTAITSSKLHFCYPQNNGTSDPYFCN